MSYAKTRLSLFVVTVLSGVLAAGAIVTPAAAQKIQTTKGARDAGQPDAQKPARGTKPDAEEPPEPLSPPMKAVVDAHPEHDLVLCMGGCGGGQPRILWQRPRIKPGETDTVPGILQASGTGSAAEQASEEIICIAGCNGPAGTVLYRGMRVAWLGDTSRDALMAALKEVESELQHARRQRSWMSSQAREHLSAAMQAAEARPAAVAAVGN